MERVAEWICEPCKKIVHRIEFFENQDEAIFRLRPMTCGLCGKEAFFKVRNKEKVSEEESQVWVEPEDCP